MIYLASPYSANPETNYWRAVNAVGQLYVLGQVVYSPVVHYHEVARQHGLPTDQDYWRHANETMMRAATEFAVLTLPGWRESYGVAREMAWWNSNKKLPPQYYDPDEINRLYETNFSYYSRK